MSLSQEPQHPELARRFFLATVAQAAVCLAGSWLLAFFFGKPDPAAGLRLPVAFQVGTALLIAGSVFLHQAVASVRLEQQVAFRRKLTSALTTAVLFVMIQSYGLWAFATAAADRMDTQTNVHGFVFLFVSVHGLHFIVAQSILLWITLNARAGRYDHEYHWGPVFAAWCWHALGAVWLLILLLFMFATVDQAPPR